MLSVLYASLHIVQIVFGQWLQPKFDIHENVVKVTHHLLMKASGLESGKKLGPPLPVSVTRGTGRYFI